MTNREAQVADAAERDEEFEAVAGILNDAFANDPEVLRAGMRERFGEQLDARHPRIGPTRGYGHEYTPHPIYTKWHATTATVCIWCDCRKDWLTLIGSKVCSAHTTHMKKEAARGRSDRPQHDSGSRLAGAHDE